MQVLIICGVKAGDALKIKKLLETNKDDEVGSLRVG